MKTMKGNLVNMFLEWTVEIKFIQTQNKTESKPKHESRLSAGHGLNDESPHVTDVDIITASGAAVVLKLSDK